MLPAIFCAFLNKWLSFNVISHLFCLSRFNRVYNFYTSVVPDMIAVKDRNTFTFVFVDSCKPDFILHSCFCFVAYALLFL